MSKRTIILLLIVLVSLGALLFVVFKTTSSPDLKQKEHPSLISLPQNNLQWEELSPEHSVEIEIAQNQPAFQLGQLQLLPTPIPKGTTNISWTHQQQEGRHLLLGSGTWQDHKVSWRWVLSPGNPQADFSISLGPIPWNQLNQPIEATITLPPNAKLQWVNASYEKLSMSSDHYIDAWQGPWFQMTHPNTMPVTWSNLQVERLRPTADNSELRVTLFDPKVHNLPEDCDSPLTINASWTMTLGDRLSAYPSRLPQGRLAALSPVFIDPAEHPNPSFHKTSAKTPQDLAKRITTLQFGHSNPKDPRYANGGLFGIGAGASFVIPQAWASDPAIKTLRKQLGKTRTTLSAQGDISRIGDPYKGFITQQGASCEVFNKNQDATLMMPTSVLKEGRLLNAIGTNVSLTINDTKIKSYAPGLRSSSPTTLNIPFHSGNQAQFERQTFSPKSLEKLISARGTSWFIAPLVATRNPLLEAASQSLLEPESKGHWTISSSWTRALSNIDLINEEPQLLIAPPELLTTHWKRSRLVHIQESSDASLFLTHQGKQPITGFTLIVPGQVTPTIKGTTPQVRHLPNAKGQPQTWISWDLQPGSTHMTFNTKAKALDAILWRPKFT